MVLLLTLSSILIFSVSASSNQEVAISKIYEAEKSMRQAYEAVLDAEEAGANVSGLLVKLNDAVGLLSEARVAFEAGNFEEATGLASLCMEVCGRAGSQAEKLRVEANYAHGNMSFWISIGSVFSVSIVVCASLLGYRYFKRWYYRRLLKMKPRVGHV